MNDPVRVEIIESEAGWGQKVDEVIEFPTHDEAVDFVKKYNNKYNPPLPDTPSWYMYARLENDNSLHMMR